MKEIAIDTWDRRQLFDHFKSFIDPYFGVTIPFDVSRAHTFSKANNVSFFAKYLHACLKAINDIENFKYRIIDGKPVLYDVIHASATVLRADNTFGFSFVTFDNDLAGFINNLEQEKTRIMSSSELFPPINSLDCIYCSAMPWINFSGHKEPVSNKEKSVPQFAFGKMQDGSDECVNTCKPCLG